MSDGSRVAVRDVDVRRVESLEGLAAYGAVEVLFRDQGVPVGRARLLAPSARLRAEAIRKACPPFPKGDRTARTPGIIPTLSVAVCTRDRPRELAAALTTLARQETPPLEILVVENGEAGETRAVVQRCLPSARFLHEPEAGLDFARNRALMAAGGDLIAFLDDDAEADPQWAGRIVEAFANDAEIGALTGLTMPLELETTAQCLFEANGGYGRGFEVRRVRRHEGMWHELLRPLPARVLNSGNGCNMAFRVSVLRAVSGFDPALDAGPPLPGGGDLDALLRVCQAGHDILYEPRALVRHRHRRTLDAMDKQLAGHHRAGVAYLVKSVAGASGIARLGGVLFLIWRLVKNPLRLLRSCVGLDPLPPRTLAAMSKAAVAGLGSYSLSKARQRRHVRRHGGRPPNARSQAIDTWLHRELVWRLTQRDLKAKYQGSWLGFLWTLINPLVTIGVMVVVFSQIVRIPVDRYWAFLLSGYFVWSFFAQTLTGGVQSAAGNAYLTRSAWFPQESLVLAAGIARFLEFAIEMTIVAVVLAIFHHGAIPASYLALPIIVPALFIVVIGVAFPIAALAVYYVDTVHALPLAIAALFYATPVFYPLSIVPEPLRAFFALNPMAFLIDLFHDTLYKGVLPSSAELGLTVLGGIAIAGTGYWLFNRHKRNFAELL